MSFAIRAGDQWYEAPRTHFHIVMDITDHCPYRCSYCYEASDIAKQEVSFENFCQAINAIRNIKNQPLPYKFVFFGGEPTCHPRFLDMVRYVQETLPNVTLAATSNGYRKLAFFKELYAIDPEFRLSFSVHFEHIDDNETLEKIHFLDQNSVHSVVNVLYHPAMRERIQRFVMNAHAIVGRNVKIIIKFLRSKESNFKNNLLEYTCEDYSFLKNYGENLLKAFIDYTSDTGAYRKEYVFGNEAQYSPGDFAHMMCTYPMNRLRIKIDGRAFNAQCYKIKKFNVFNNEEIECITQPVRCISPKCVCADQRRAAKFSDIQFAPLYLNGDKNFAYKEFPASPLLKGEAHG